MAPHTMWDLLQHSLGSLAPRMQDLGRFVISVGIFTRLGGEASEGATPHAHDGFVDVHVMMLGAIHRACTR